MSYTPLANILKKNLRNLRKLIIRDYNEIEELQSSVKDTKLFIKKSQKKIEEEVVSLLTKIKPNFQIVKKWDFLVLQLIGLIIIIINLKNQFFTLIYIPTLIKI